MKVKWGVIGCGGIADRRTLPGMMLAENAELIAVMDINHEAANLCKEKYNAKYAKNYRCLRCFTKGALYLKWSLSD